MTNEEKIAKLEKKTQQFISSDREGLLFHLRNMLEATIKFETKESIRVVAIYLIGELLPKVYMGLYRENGTSQLNIGMLPGPISSFKTLCEKIWNYNVEYEWFKDICCDKDDIFRTISLRKFKDAYRATNIGFSPQQCPKTWETIDEWFFPDDRPARLGPERNLMYLLGDKCSPSMIHLMRQIMMLLYDYETDKDARL